jgi:hypothetical protein
VDLEVRQLVNGEGIERRAEGEWRRLEAGGIRGRHHVVGGAGRYRRVLRAGDEPTRSEDGDDETCKATA